MFRLIFEVDGAIITLKNTIQKNNVNLFHLKKFYENHTHTSYTVQSDFRLRVYSANYIAHYFSQIGRNGYFNPHNFTKNDHK